MGPPPGRYRDSSFFCNKACLEWILPAINLSSTATVSPKVLSSSARINGDTWGLLKGLFEQSLRSPQAFPAAWHVWSPCGRSSLLAQHPAHLRPGLTPSLGAPSINLLELYFSLFVGLDEQICPSSCVIWCFFTALPATQVNYGDTWAWKTAARHTVHIRVTDCMSLFSITVHGSFFFSSL